MALHGPIWYIENIQNIGKWGIWEYEVCMETRKKSKWNDMIKMYKRDKILNLGKTENLEKIENREKQAEAEVVPSSGSVEVKLSVKV